MILALDTSGQQACGAIVSDIVLGEFVINAHHGTKSWHHSEILMPAVDYMFNTTGLSLSDIKYIAVTIGPGSFTGIKIAVACAMGLAKGANLPIIPVPTLDAMAENIITNKTIIPMLDARGGQVYSAMYRQGKRLTDYTASTVQDILKGQYNIMVLGCGADAYKDIILELCPLVEYAPIHLNRQRAASAAFWASKHIHLSTNTFELIYAREPQAVRAKSGL